MVKEAGVAGAMPPEQELYLYPTRSARFISDIDQVWTGSDRTDPVRIYSRRSGPVRINDPTVQTGPRF